MHRVRFLAPKRPSSSAASGPDLSSWDPRVVRPYKGQGFLKVLNSFVVFRLCAIPSFVRWGPVLLETVEKLPGLKHASHVVVKNTFFRHFCGGEDIAEVHATMLAYRQRGLGVILNYAVEAEVSAAEPSLDKVVAEASRVLRGMKESADIAAEHPQNFIAAKLTPYIPPAVLLRYTNSLRLLKATFDSHSKNGQVSRELFLSDAFSNVFPGLRDSGPQVYGQLDPTNKGSFDFIDLTNVFTISNHVARSSLLVPSSNSTTTPPHALLATKSDFEIFDAIVPLLESLIAHAKSLNVKVIIDAEWTYVQPAIDDLALHLSKKFNGCRNDASQGINNGRPIIFNTYQMYLQDALQRVQWELERAKRGNYNIGVKIVRGAYIVSESERAQKMNYPNPICRSLEDTHKSFNGAIDLCISEIKKHTPEPNADTPLPVQFFIASHNKESVLHAWLTLQRLQLNPQSDCVGFGQLMGMQDGTSYGIAANGLKGYKCVPYGPVPVAIPYLVRRAQENSAVLGGVKVDKDNLWDELKTRVGLQN
ncbi:FAD-linked oxidoreductase-like protein [Obelidium mucronatum]|nr:FAD-linked oxidoreductase-like protein [Obelidium mucronatum]